MMNIQGKLKRGDVVAATQVHHRVGMRPARVVLVKMGRDFVSDQVEWVTALHCNDEAEWLHGHYFASEAEAWESFAERSRKLLESA